MDSLPRLSISHDFNLLANHMFLTLPIFRFREMCIKKLQKQRVTESYSYSCSYNVTDRSSRAHWIPQCGPGSKAADGALYGSHTPCPSRLQHPWTSYSTAPTKSEGNPTYGIGFEQRHSPKKNNSLCTGNRFKYINIKGNIRRISSYTWLFAKNTG